MENDPIALLVADLHLSLKAPVARSAEPCWLSAQVRPLKELKRLAKEHDVPIVCAGDIFEKWNSPPEIINWAIRNLPKMYAVPGQHDLPHHSYEDIKRSAYWTLVEAGIISELGMHVFGGNWFYRVQCGKILMYGFPWGAELESVPREDENHLHIAVIHRYLYTDKHGGYPGPPKENHISSLKEKLKGYDVAVFGDNHEGFRVLAFNGCEVYNCGCLIRRKLNEKGYKPAVGLLYENGDIEPHYLDTLQDKWAEIEHVEEERDDSDMRDFLDELERLDSGSFDFCGEVRRFLQDGKVSKGAKELLLEAIGD